jgi:hypothetical protein
VTIGLLSVDGYKFPNLALMKLSAWHKSQGDHVELADMFGSYDRLYMSKIFTFKLDDLMIYDAQEIIRGGTGYGDYTTVLPDEVEHSMPDYSLFGIDYAVGFTTRGCPNKCSWCVVSKKEGGIRTNAPITEFWNGQRNLMLLDNNILASEFGLEQLEETARREIHIDCNQGLDARIISKDVEIQKLLARNKWCRPITLACDQKNQMGSVEKSVEGIRKYTGKQTPIMVYTLLKDDMEDALERIHFLRAMKYVDPFAQPYRDFTGAYNPPQWQRDMARWVNMKSTFRSVEWNDYKKESK